MAEQGELFVAGTELSRTRLWEVLERWQLQGWIRALDLALVQMLADLDPQAAPELLLAACMTSHQLGRGHICLDLEATLKDPDAALSLPPEGAFGEALPDRPSELLSGWSLAHWLDALVASSLVVADGEASDSGAPLVLDRGAPARLYLRRQWQYERAVAAALRRRLGGAMSLPAEVPPLLDQLFPPAVGQAVDWQRAACALAAMSRFAIITGGPGTGKTTTVVRLLALLQSRARAQGQSLRIRLAAPTGKAAARLTESISQAIGRLPQGMAEGVPDEVSTLHRLLGSRPDTRHFRHGALNPLHADLVVVDEASMIDLEMMHALLCALPERAALVLLGDKDQLASVEAGAVLGDLCQQAQWGGYQPQVLAALSAAGAGDLAAWQAAEGQAGGDPLAQRMVMLRHSHRFGADSGIGQLARAVNAGDSDRALQLLRKSRDDLALVRTEATLTPLKALLLGGGPLGDRGAVKGFAPYLKQLQSSRPQAEDFADPAWQVWAQELLRAFADFRLLCALRRGAWGVEGLNERIEQLLAQSGRLATGEPWYEGRPVMVTRNDYGLGLMNGDIGICLRVPQSKDGSSALRVVFPLPGGELKWVLPSRLQSVETVFAMTVHKSQGSEFTHTALVLPDKPNPVLTRELVYTAITRARTAFTLVLPEEARLREAVATPVHRASALRQRILADGD